jgi:hypothetical protein
MGIDGGSVPNRNVTGPRAGQQVSNGADQLWSTGQQASVEPSPAERDDKSTAWPDIAPQLSDDAADQKPFAISADQTPHAPKPGQKVSSAKKAAGDHVSAAPLQTSETDGEHKNVHDKREEAFRVLLESARASVPERLVKLQLQPFVRPFESTAGTPEAAKQGTAAQTNASPADWPRLTGRGWRPSAGAIRLLTGTSILATGIGAFYVLFGLYGNEIEQAGVASARSAGTWLQHIRSNGPSPSSEPATTAEKTLHPEQPEADRASTDAKSATASGDTTSSKVAGLSPAANASKPGEGSVEAIPAPNPSKDVWAPPASSAAELPSAVTPARPSDPNTQGQLARPTLANKISLPNEIPLKNSTPPNTPPALSSATIPTGVSEGVPQSTQAPPVSAVPQQSRPTAAPQETASIDAVGLVRRGDQLLGTRDVIAARLFYERAAEAGDGQGALRMGMTFDPRSGLHGVRGDPAQAMSWYHRASALGNTEAEQLQSGLTVKQEQ